MSEDSMTDEELDVLFKKLVDTFIDVANEQAAYSSIENISMALLHAASRFNAYVVSSHSSTLLDYEQDLDKARAFFIVEYEKMLGDNLTDYKKIYDQEAKYLHLIK